MRRDLEHPNFDLKYQEAVLHLALTDNEFARSLYIYLAPEKGQKRLNAFTNAHFQLIYNCLSSAMKEYDKIPSEGHIYNYIDERHEADEALLVKKVVKRLLELSVPDPEYYRRNLTKYVQAVKIANRLKEVEDKWQETGNVLAGKEVLKELSAEIDQIDLEESAFQTLGSLIEEIDDPDAVPTEYIKTRIPELDDALNGGMPKGALVMVLGPNNVGKTMTIIDIVGCAAILEGKKVLHVPLDGRGGEARSRYISNLCNIPNQRVEKKTFDAYEKDKIREIGKKLDSQLLIFNFADYSPKAEKLITKLESIKKRFDYDVVIVDYIGCLGTMERTSTMREVNVITHRLMRGFAVKNNVLVVSPAQANREGQRRNNGTDGIKDKGGKYILRSTDIAESDDIGRVAEIIFTLNRDDQEMQEERLRLYLEKQRQGKKGLLFGLHTQYGYCRVNTGRYYNPNEVVGVELLEEGAQDAAKTKVFTERDRTELKKKCSSYINEKRSLQEQLNTLQENLNQISDPAERTKNKEYIFSLESRIKDLVDKVKKNAALIFPGATVELYKSMQDQLADMEKNSSAKLDIEKTKFEVTILKYLFMGNDPK